MVQVRQRGSGLIVAQVAVFAAHAPLQKRRVARCGQHGRVVIGFQHECVAARQLPQHIGCDVPQIRQDAQVARAIRAAKLEWLTRIMRYGEGADLQRADRQHLPVPRDVRGPFVASVAQGLCGARAGPQRCAVTLRQQRRAANVVAMLVGDEDGVDVVGRQVAARQRSLQLPPAQAAIDQHPCAVRTLGGLDQRGVASAAAGQTAKAQHRRGRAALTSVRPPARA